MRRRRLRLRPRSLRARLVLGATFLAVLAVALCQAAELAVLNTWLTSQVDRRLTRFQPIPEFYRDAAEGPEGADSGTAAARNSVLPSDYRVYFYGDDGRKLSVSLGNGDQRTGPLLPSAASSLGLEDGQLETVPSDDGTSQWRIIARSGTNGARAVVALPLESVEEANSRMLWFSLVTSAAVVAGLALFGTIVVGLGLRPLRRVEHTARRIADGELELTVADRDSVTEVAHLVRALNTMLDRLRSALHRKETSEQRLRRFLADAGHELRTPLTSLQGFAELLVHDPDMTVESRQEAHHLIVQNAERMSRLVDSMFQLAKLSDAPATRHEPVDLLSLTADSITSVGVHHPGRSIGLGALTDRDEGPVSAELDVVQTCGDSHQLTQVVTNLLTNACTHTPAGSRVRVRVGTLRVRPHGPGTDRPGRTSANPPLAPGSRACVIEVADDGPGLATAEASRVFERFYRGSRSHASGAEDGSGLGLAIASAIAAAHHGRLELDTRPGRGCVFRLLLPHETAAPPDLPQEPTRTGAGRPGTCGPL